MPLPRLGELLLHIRPLGPRTVHGLRRGAASVEQPLGHTLVLLHQRGRGVVDLGHTPRRGFLEVGDLHVGGQLARRGRARHALPVLAPARQRVVGANPLVEERLAEPHARLMTLRQREVDVRREAIRPRELVQRRVRRVYQVADVRHAVEVRVAGIEHEGGKEQPARLPHVRVGTAFGQPLSLEPQVRAQRLGDQLPERVRPLGLEGGWGAGEEHACEHP